MGYLSDKYSIIATVLIEMFSTLMIYLLALTQCVDFE